MVFSFHLASVLGMARYHINTLVSILISYHRWQITFSVHWSEALQPLIAVLGRKFMCWRGLKLSVKTWLCGVYSVCIWGPRNLRLVWDLKFVTNIHINLVFSQIITPIIPLAYKNVFNYKKHFRFDCIFVTCWWQWFCVCGHMYCTSWARGREASLG